MKLDRPIFVKGHIDFVVEGHHLAFRDRAISVSGVTTLPWSPLSPKKNFGTIVKANLQIPSATSPTPLRMEVRAVLTREQTTSQQYMSISFRLSPGERDQLAALIAQNGYYPQDYTRKYPRLPSSQAIQTFPLRVLARPLDAPEMAPVIFDVLNLSIGGLLIATENPFSLTLTPGMSLEVYLEPRGDFSVQVHVQAIVRRILDEIHPETGNLVRRIGIQFSRVDTDNRNAYLELIKDILLKFKAREAP